MLRAAEQKAAPATNTSQGCSRVHGIKKNPNKAHKQQAAGCGVCACQLPHTQASKLLG